MLIYAPDAIDIAPETLSAVSGIPTMRGYRSPPAAYDFTSTQLSGTAIIAAWLLNAAGTARGFVATGTKLYEYQSDGWTDRSAGGGTYTNSDFSSFASFGTGYFYCSGSTQLQHSTTGAFANVTAAPKARCMATAGYFMMLGATDDGSVSGLSTGFGLQENRWWCSRYADATGTWVPSVTTQCTSGLLADSPDAIRAVHGMGADFIFYKNSAMYRAYYVGPDEVFRFDRLTQKVGCPTQHAVVPVEDTHYFIGNDDIYSYTQGTAGPVSIGAGVREWFFGQLDKGTWSYIEGRYDALNQLVYWHYPPTGASGALTRVLCYHVPTKRFGAFNLSVNCIFSTTNGVLWSSTSDGSARQLEMAYIDSSNYIKSLSAVGTAFTCTTGWYGDEQQVSLCKRVKPRFRAGPSGGTLTPSNALYLTGTESTGSAQSISAGRFDVLQSARYHRFALSLTGDTEVEAINPLLVPEGEE